MDYVEMIKDPELVLGFQELVSDSDPVVVKRTVKVFTSVYYHTLRLLSSGELEVETLLKSWKSVKCVVDTLLAMVKRCENEGILIHLLRFLEAAIMSHLMFDLSNFPLVFERGRDVVKTGLKALKDLVTTPYVGGSAFIVGIRALISIACLRPDLWEPVTDLLKKQLASLPPTLFDHNVRSLNKTLQRNLFRLLRRAETPELKEKLIEMMVSVGVPRKVIMPWAPVAAAKKRSPTRPTSDDVYLGRVTPPEKRQRTEPAASQVPKPCPPSKAPEVPLDPRLAVPQDPRKGNLKASESSSTAAKPSNAELMFLTSLIPVNKSEEGAPAPPREPSLLEQELNKNLNLNRVCSLVIQHVNSIPETEPFGFQESFRSQGDAKASSETLRKRLVAMLARYLAEHNLKSLAQQIDSKPNSPIPPPEVSKPHESPESNFASAEMDKERSNSNSLSSTPSSTPPLMDTDLRQVYQRPPAPKGDVDMRIMDPRLVARDPRVSKDPRIRKDVVDPRMAYTEQKEARSDPRLDRVAEMKPRSDPRLPTKESSKRGNEPRKSRWDPRLPQEEDVNVSVHSGSVAQPSMPLNDIASARSGDPRINRPNMPQGQGLLPHPDPRAFQQETVDPRLHLPTQGAAGGPRMQQNFASQPPFPFGPMNPMNQFNNPFIRGLSLPPNAAMPPPMLNGPAFGWQNMRNPPPHMLVAQTLASVQSGMLPHALINL